jgi:hypothetical protein
MDPKTHITPNFTWAELRIDPLTAPKSVRSRATLLCERLLQPLRDRVGRIDVTSGYRPYVAKAKRTDHNFTSGAAVDARPYGQVSGLHGAQLLLDALRAGNIPFDQIIGYLPGTALDPDGTHTHLGWREKARYQILLAFPDKDGVTSYKSVMNFLEQT